MSVWTAGGTGLRVALVLLIAVVLVLALAWGLQRRIIYLPDTAPVPPAARFADGARDVTVRTSDGLELGAWFFVPLGEARDMAVLVAHGNAGNRVDRAPLATALAREGFAVLLFDYRGYGGNPGAPSEEGFARDARAAVRTLTEDLGFPPERTLYLGESIGSGVASRLAVERPPAGLVLRSPFTDLAAAGRKHYPYLPLRLILRDRYPVAEHVRRVDVPTTVVYGTGDTVIPPEQSRDVADAAANLHEQVPVAGADHNDRVFLDGEELIGAVTRLAEHVDH